MPYLEIKDSSNKKYERFTFSNEQTMVNFIKNIKTKDIYEKTYTFYPDKEDIDLMMELEYFFKSTFNHNFFKKDGYGYTLCVMPNGLHREIKTKARKSFNNRILKRTFDKVLEEVNCYSEPYFLKFDSKRVHFITFYKDHYSYVDRHMYKKRAFVEIWFDKLSWSYKIGEVTLYDAVFLESLLKSLEKNTKHLREYRKKKQNEDNT